MAEKLTKNMSSTLALESLFRNCGQLTYPQARNQLDGYGLTPKTYLIVTAKWIEEQFPAHKTKYAKGPGKRVDHSANIMEVAATLNQPFHLNELVVALFEAYPDLYRMPGVDGDYPDSHKVAAFVMGKRARLIKDGLIVQLGDNMYQVGQ